MLTFGEGWHNGHHAYEFIAVLPENLETNGRKAYQFDSSWKAERSPRRSKAGHMTDEQRRARPTDRARQAQLNRFLGLESSTWGER
jgi:hypothetical protein